MSLLKGHRDTVESRHWSVEQQGLRIGIHHVSRSFPSTPTLAAVSPKVAIAWETDRQPTGEMPGGEKTV